MKHWTQELVPASGLALMVAGVALARVDSVWGGVACAALGVLLLLGLRVVEHYADVRAALAVTGDVAALKCAVARLEDAQKKADEGVRTALAGVMEARQNRPKGGGY